MKVIVLASGSKGNATYVEYKNTKILIDFGMNLTYVKNHLQDHDVSLKDIDAVLITHTHSDHIGGLETFTKKHNAKIYLTAKMKKEINIKICELFEDITIIKDISIEIIHTSHDKASVGFIIKGNKEIVYITDTGYLKEAYYEKITNKELYIFESNHDIEMLMNGPYPYHLKRRILSDKGHLSNETAAHHLKNIVGDKTKYIVLAHLSEHNNCETIAHNTLQECLGETTIRIIIAKQNEPLKAIKI